MNDVRSDLRSFYEEEARQELRRDLTGARVSVRDKFVELLHREARTTVIDFGAGPGGDVGGFLEAGLTCIGLDLAHGNGVLAARRNMVVLQASIDAPPVRPASFQAGWSMSTLMHVPEAAVPSTVAAMAATLEPGAPMFVGQWGGELGDQISTETIQGEQRLFSLRSLDRNRDLLETCGQVEEAQIWPAGPDGWEYHLMLVRV